MNCKKSRFVTGIAACVIAFGLAPVASAQVFTGRIDVTVEDATGGRLPGVNVDLTGPVNQAQITDSQGQAHFLNLTVGTYTIRASISGFTPYVNQTVQVAAGAGTPLAIRLAVAGTAETVNVTAATPLIDTRKQATATNITLEELQDIPTARDPWVVLQTVPTIVMDRVNVGGSESGQQSNYFAKGADTKDNTWNIDGIPFTDMVATGSSTTYYDFDMFQEMQVSTGGADAQATTPGVQLNFVVKSGANTPHGAARFYFENDSLQGNNVTPDLKALVNPTTGKGNRTDDYKDRGFDVGGPLMKDKLWAWGSYGRTNVDTLTLNGFHDKTQLENYGLKITAQPTASIRPEFMYFRGNKVKDGRSASPTRPPETTWFQEGPTDIFKGQVNFTIGQQMFLAVRGAHVKSGFSLTPKGGNSLAAFRDVNRVWHNSYLFFASDRPQDTALADANYFKGRHEIKAGFTYRKAGDDSTQHWPGNGVYNLHRSTYATNGAILGIALRPWRTITETKYYGAYVGDTWTMDRLTLNLALRWDAGRGSALATHQDAQPLVPNDMPAIDAPAVNNALKTSLATPRVGLTYAVDSARKTLLRASYSMFASQLPAAEAGNLSAASYAYAYYFGTDTNRNGTLDAGEPRSFAGGVGFDPANPAKAENFWRVDPKFRAPRTHEFLVGADREIVPNFAVSGAFTYRHIMDVLWHPLVGVTRADYVQDGTLADSLPTIGSFRQPFYAIKESAVPTGAGRVEANRDGYHQRYLGVELSATKRMANHWMARLGFSSNSHREYFDDPNKSIQDPTPTVSTGWGSTHNTGGPLIDGGLVMFQSTGSGKSNIFMVLPQYQFIANGMYEGPFGLNFGGNLVTRQGYAGPFFSGQTDTSDSVSPQKDVLVVSPVDKFRLPTVTSLDARVEKAFKFSRTSVMVDLDLFNLFNRATILQRQFDINATGNTGFNNVLEITQPRIARIGVRMTF